MGARILAALGFIALLQPASLLAQRSPWGGPDSPGGLLGGDPMDADLDRDQRVSHDEVWQWLRQRLGQHDQNRDGAVTLPESGVHPDRAEDFRAMDTDRDGKLTAGELRAGSEAWFRNRDLNRDGALTRQELGPAPSRPAAQSAPVRPR
ncbi:hypothetical protein JMJ56_18270 [Belnapia sp. T18]|uniref:EF-hand domain-containing protein n=1 Tax=Belnapia arida TaxID=2804533 RepID=A0ABS1U5K8_9PROT|nr:hypothetical protein [Belnapia arida]MBL6079970.1 hypothetical protein [Belnapia arida]